MLLRNIFIRHPHSLCALNAQGQTPIEIAYTHCPSLALQLLQIAITGYLEHGVDLLPQRFWQGGLKEHKRVMGQVLKNKIDALIEAGDAGDAGVFDATIDWQGNRELKAAITEGRLGTIYAAYKQILQLKNILLQEGPVSNSSLEGAWNACYRFMQF